jgi:hypothetical protein
VPTVTSRWLGPQRPHPPCWSARAWEKPWSAVSQPRYISQRSATTSTTPNTPPDRGYHHVTAVLTATSSTGPHSNTTRRTPHVHIAGTLPRARSGSWCRSLTRSCRLHAVRRRREVTKADNHRALPTQVSRRVDGRHRGPTGHPKDTIQDRRFFLRTGRRDLPGGRLGGRGRRAPPGGSTAAGPVLISHPLRVSCSAHPVEPQLGRLRPLRVSCLDLWVRQGQGHGRFKIP